MIKKDLKFTTLHLLENIYLIKDYNDEYLSMLAEIFDDGSYWTDAVKRRLIDPTSTHVTGNKTTVIIENNKITIQPFGIQDPEDWAIEIDRNLLLQLINTWQDLVTKDAQEIMLIRHDDGFITMTGS